MNRLRRSVVVGMVLGDGHIRTSSAADKLAGRRIAPQISFSHSYKQKDYAGYKVNLLNKFFGGNATLREHIYNGYRFVAAAKSNPYLKTLKGMMYRNGKLFITRSVLDMLSPEGIAIWFMDDGSCSYRRKANGDISSVSISLCSYHTEPEIEVIIGYFQDVHGIECKKSFHKRSGLWCVRMNTDASRQFESLVRPFMHHSMMYKLEHDFSVRQEIRTPCVKCGKIGIFCRMMCAKCYHDERRLRKAMI